MDQVQGQLFTVTYEGRAFAVVHARGSASACRIAAGLLASSAGDVDLDDATEEEIRQKPLHRRQQAKLCARRPTMAERRRWALKEITRSTNSDVALAVIQL
jgi:hypothetical protein